MPPCSRKHSELELLLSIAIEDIFPLSSMKDPAYKDPAINYACFSVDEEDMAPLDRKFNKLSNVEKWRSTNCITDTPSILLSHSLEDRIFTRRVLEKGVNFGLRIELGS